MNRRRTVFLLSLIVMISSIFITKEQSAETEKVNVVKIGNINIDFSTDDKMKYIIINILDDKGNVMNNVVLHNNCGNPEALYISDNKHIYITINNYLIIYNTQNKSISIIYNWYSASMYLVDKMIYSELAHNDPYGEGIDIITLQRTGPYYKIRPFDIKNALKAETIKIRR